ncbi:hypothetical protein B0A49_06152 [Cryomyces minteri]|uniref:Uncharacterized protein n=1 Tax=Cryomyces minteri TaxID=331657 RepID=A0A4U0XBL5_9PEZI|nr:hypothetical protein B0A49_06152 [Cryomyces minteri]
MPTATVPIAINTFRTRRAFRVLLLVGQRLDWDEVPHVQEAEYDLYVLLLNAVVLSYIAEATANEAPIHMQSSGNDGRAIRRRYEIIVVPGAPRSDTKRPAGQTDLLQRRRGQQHHLHLNLHEPRKDQQTMMSPLIPKVSQSLRDGEVDNGKAGD